LVPSNFGSIAGLRSAYCDFTAIKGVLCTASPIIRRRRTTLEVGRALPNSFMIASSYSGNWVFRRNLHDLVAVRLELSQKLRQRQCGALNELFTNFG
jgi:hypothetical protein